MGRKLGAVERFERRQAAEKRAAAKKAAEAEAKARHLYESRVVVGFDTETFQGFCKLLCASNGHYLETDDTDTLLGFFYRELEAAEADFGVFYNLGFDFAAVVKRYVMEHAEDLRKQHYHLIQVRKKLAKLAYQAEVGALDRKQTLEMKTLFHELDGTETIEQFDTEHFHIRYVGGKGVGLKPRGKGCSRKRTRWLFDAAVFYQEGHGAMRLETAASKYLGDHKSDEELGISRERIGEEAGYYEANRELIIRYCVKDSDLARRLMERTIEAYGKLGYPFPDRPFSKGSVSKALLEANGCMNATQARYESLDRSASRALWNKSFLGGVFLLRTAGHVENAYGLDINSAYPDALRSFPSLEKAILVEPNDPRFSQCFFRFYRIRACPTPRLPLKEKKSLRKIYGWSNEPHSFVVAGPDLEALDLYGDPYTIEEAIGVWTPPDAPRPFAWIEDVFRQKDAAKGQYGGDSVEYLNIKIVANGVYGCVAQRRPRPSRFTNLIYASYTTALCRLKLWSKAKAVEATGDRVVQYATDGLTVEDRTEGRGRAAQLAASSSLLGEWDYAKGAPLTLFETGVYVLHYPEKPKLKVRGFPDLTLEALRSCPTAYWESARKAPIKLKSGIIQRRTEDIGRFFKVDRILHPAKAVRDGRMDAPKDFWSAPLCSYFEKAWPLTLTGET